MVFSKHYTVSNSNDALEKTRLLSLTDPTLLLTAPDLNVTVKADLEAGLITITGRSLLLSNLNRSSYN